VAGLGCRARGGRSHGGGRAAERALTLFLCLCSVQGRPRRRAPKRCVSQIQGGATGRAVSPVSGFGAWWGPGWVFFVVGGGPGVGGGGGGGGANRSAVASSCLPPPRGGGYKCGVRVRVLFLAAAYSWRPRPVASGRSSLFGRWKRRPWGARRFHLHLGWGAMSLMQAAGPVTCLLWSVLCGANASIKPGTVRGRGDRGQCSRAAGA
jgi:hypothetical protein